VSMPLEVGSLRPGDLLLFASTGSRVNHVAIYVGDNQILHSSAGAGGVVYDDLSTPRGKWYLARHVASRRVL
jgi:cell wall-associated NlpC family hydrolase